MKKALLIVDVQNDFVEGGSLACEGGRAVAEKIEKHAADHRDEYALIVATRDYHEPESDNGGHFAEQHAWDSTRSVSGHGFCVCGWSTGHYALASDPDLDKEFDAHLASTGPDYKNTWPHHCVQGTDGAKFAFHLVNVDVIISKGRGEPAYSGFEGKADNDQTLTEILIEHKITDLDVCGIATDYCVWATVMDALKVEFIVNVLTDLVVGVASNTSEGALKDMEQKGAALV